MAKFATNASGVMLLLNLIKVMESISGSAETLAMFHGKGKRNYENPKTFVNQKMQNYLQTNGVYMRASGITLVSGPLVTVTPQYTPIAPTTAKDGRGSFIQNTKGRTNTKGRLNCIYTFF